MKHWQADPRETQGERGRGGSADKSCFKQDQAYSSEGLSSLLHTCLLVQPDWSTDTPRLSSLPFPSPPLSYPPTQHTHSPAIITPAVFQGRHKIEHSFLTPESTHLQDGVIRPALVIVVHEEVATLTVLCTCILGKVEVHITQLVEGRGGEGRREVREMPFK